MTLPWLPIPRALASAEHAGWLLLTPPALRTALLLALRASDEGTVPRAGEAPERVLDAIVGTGAGEHLTELVGRGVLRVERTSLVLPDVMKWRHECTPGATHPTPEQPTVALTTPVSDATASTEPKTTAARQLSIDRSTFKARRKQWRRVPPDVTWAAWLRGPEGIAFLLGRERKYGGYTVLASDTHGQHRATPTGNIGQHPRATSGNIGQHIPLSHSPPPSERREQDTESAEEIPRPARVAREGEGATVGQRSGNTPGQHPQATSGDDPPPLTCATTEFTAPPVTASEILFHLRREGKLRLSATPTHEAELARHLEGVTPAWTLDGAKRLARHIGVGHLRDGWRPKLDDLRGRDATWSRLLSLYDEAYDCPRCAEAQPASPTRVPRKEPVRATKEPSSSEGMDQWLQAQRTKLGINAGSKS